MCQLMDAKQQNCQVLGHHADATPTIRALQAALPHAPAGKGQVVRDAVILHTTLARMVDPPRGHGTLQAGQGAGPALLRGAAESMSARLCGLEATLDSIWYASSKTLLYMT